jgi:DNA-binding NarL/FixJ family response regulator
MGKITIIIADEPKLTKEAWSQIIGENFNLSGLATCSDAQEVVDIANDKRPDVILMDIMLNPLFLTV